MSGLSSCLLALAGALVACSDNIATCPEGTVRRDGECIETRDGGGTRGDANGDSNGVTNQGEAGVDSGTDSGARDAGPKDAGSDSGMTMLDSGIKPCVPTTEICNGLDDDCNGKADEGMLVVSAATTKEWDLAAPMTETSERGLSALLPRQGGGAYLLYKLLASADTASALSVVRFDQNGAVVPFPLAAPQANDTQTGLLPTSRTFLAASYGNYVAIMYFESDGDGNVTEDDPPPSPAGVIKLSLWQEDVNDGLLKQVGTPVELLADNADLASLSVIPGPAGALRILAAYSDAGDNTDNATGVLPPRLHTFGLAAGAVAITEIAPYVELIRPVSGMPNVNAGATVRIVPDPCGAGWLIAYFDPPSTGSVIADRETYLRTVSSEGALGSVLWGSGKGFGFQGMGIDGLCVERKSRVLVTLNTAANTLEGRELLWTRDATAVTSGTVIESGTKLLEPTTFPFTQILHQGGLWFVTYRTFGGIRGLWELDMLADSLRAIALPIDPGPLSRAGLDVRDTNMFFTPTHSLVPLASGPFITFSNASSNKTVDATANPLGAETAAVTYRLACP